MSEAENLRSKAKRALRLAKSLSDRSASQALAAHAETLLERAESLEQATAAATAGSAPRGRLVGVSLADEHGHLSERVRGASSRNAARNLALA